MAPSCSGTRRRPPALVRAAPVVLWLLTVAHGLPAASDPPASLQQPGFVGSWIDRAADVTQTALGQLSSQQQLQRQQRQQPPPLWEQQGAGRPAAPSRAGIGQFFARAFKIIGNVMAGNSAQIDAAMAGFGPNRKPAHSDEDTMLGGLMGYTNGYAFGLDEPGWRTDPFAQPGLMKSDECAFTLNRWLSRCEWAQANYLQLQLRLGEAARFHATMAGGSIDPGSAPAVAAAGEAGAVRPSAPSVNEMALKSALKSRMLDGMEKLRGQYKSATPTQKELQANTYQDALFKYKVNPPLKERISLPENLLKSYEGPKVMQTGPTWSKTKDVPPHVAQADALWSNPQKTRAGFGREPQVDKSMGAEQCYQHMNRWLNKCVLTPM